MCVELLLPFKISTVYLSFDVHSGVRWLNIHVYQGGVHVSVRGEKTEVQVSLYNTD